MDGNQKEHVDRFLQDIISSRAAHRTRASEFVSFSSVFIGILLVGFGYLTKEPNVTISVCVSLSFAVSFLLFLATVFISIISWRKSFATIRWPSAERLTSANYIKYTESNYEYILNSLQNCSKLITIAGFIFCAGLCFLGMSAVLLFLSGVDC